MQHDIALSLFERVQTLLALDASLGVVRNKNLHAALAQVCYEGIKDTQMAFGNLFSQVDFLCRAHAVNRADVADIQTMRRHSNSSRPIGDADWLYDLRALSLLIEKVADCAQPATLVGRLPTEPRPAQTHTPIQRRYVRCIVARWDENHIYATADHDDAQALLCIDYTAHAYLQPILWQGAQLNLIDCRGTHVLEPTLIVLEPDYLVDISQIARCFTDYGHHPLAYTINRLSPQTNSEAILLGNFAGRALDDIINHPTDYDWHDTMRTSFRERAMDYCTCAELGDGQHFKAAAQAQIANIQAIVDHIFGATHSGDRRQAYDRHRAILEPSFVCEHLGLQGRVDLMTTDMRLLVEQKSGKNYNIERQCPNAYGSFQKEDHYVQLLLYAALLRQNFQLPRGFSDIRLLYSKYPLPGGLVAVNDYQQLTIEAIGLRNRIVATDYAIATHGFGLVLNDLRPETLNERRLTSVLYTHYVYPQQQALLAPLHALDPVEQAYFNAMATFVYREQLAAKVGSHEGVSTSMADLWAMPLATKREMGNIYMGLTILSKEKSNARGGYDTIHLAVPDQGEGFLPNFRPGDMVYLYAYQDTPNPLNAILFKGSLVSMSLHAVTIHLNDGQQNEQILADGTYAVEHGGSDATFTAQLRSLSELARAPQQARHLLLSLRQPTADNSRQLQRSYSADYDPILQKALAANDFFLLVGPPGTGKTSMALRFMVTEALGRPEASVLLMSYTNRAVDEICDMLDSAAIDFLRIGGEYTCDARFRPHLLDHRLGNSPRLSEVRQVLTSARVVVATTSTLQSRSYLFGIKRFSLAIVDEASQILEPSLVGLLVKVPKFILIGDYKQLPAVVQQAPPQSVVTDSHLCAIGLTDCRHSLFERLYRREMALGRTQFTGILRRQGRMHPDIARWPNQMFYRREQLECVPLPHQKEMRIYPVAAPAHPTPLDTLLLNQRLIYFASPTNGSAASSDKINAAEAQMVASLLRRIYAYVGDSFDAARTVGVIVPYRNQIAMIRSAIERLGIDGLNQISIDTVERYQGSQRDVIIYSFTIQHTYQLDFLTANCIEEDGAIIDRKLNVALTRARKQLILTGHEPTLRRNRLFGLLLDNCHRGDARQLLSNPCEKDNIQKEND